MHPLSYVLLASVPILWIWNVKKNARAKGLRPPPGPKRLPLIGNMLSFPSGGKDWLTFDAWSKQYGDMVSFELFGQEFLVLSSTKRTNELFGKRSSLYSGRQMPAFLNDVLQFQFVFFTLDYGGWWRRHRRSFHEHFHPNTVERYNPALLRWSHLVIRDLLETPEQFIRHLRFLMAAVVLDVTYDYKMQGLENPYLLNAETAVQGFSRGVIFGNFWIDYAPFMIPIMKYMPSWIPGAGYRQDEKKWKAAGDFVEHKAFENVKKDIANGVDHDCVVSRLLESLPDGDPKERADAEAVARSVAATVYFAGADSTLSATINFVGAMAMYPEVQKRAHDEIDRVIGPNRLPDFSDLHSLPYVSAIVKESIRWKLVVPTVGHQVAEDDEYDGYFIKKGTIVIGNSWSILHDPEVYTNPEEFRPERFLDDGINPPAPDPEAAFGYGRRICPGRHFAFNELFITMALILATFDMSPPVDESGKPKEIKLDHFNGFVSFPSPFECVIKPRSTKAEALVRATEDMTYGA